jgi:hypothetical protein
MPSFTTKEKVEDYLAITIDAALNASVTAWIEAISDYIEKFTGRYFTPPTAFETRKFDGNGKERQTVDDFIEIQKLVVDGVEISSADYFTYPANKIPKTTVELKTGLARNSRQVVSQSFYQFTDYQQNVEITAKFGYADTVPAVIELAATKLVGGIIKEAVGDKDIKEVTSETLGDYQATYANIKDIAHALKIEDLLKPFIKDDGRAKTGVITV